jgi:putative heme-binding domain-containing protein
MTPQALASLRQIYENDLNAKKNPLFRHKVLDVPIEQYQDFALGHSGDSRRGQRLFHDLKGVGCIRCHRIIGEGGEIGPDLTGIRSKYGRADIVESVLYPSKRILDGFQQVFFELKGEDDLSGIVRAENADQVTIIDSAGARHVLEKTNITSRKVSKISLMPEGLQAGLSLSEFSDLIAYVENPNLPAPPPPGGRPPFPHPAGQPARPSVPKIPPPRLESPEDMFNPFVNIPDEPLTAPAELVAAAPAPPEPVASPPPPPPPAPPAEKAVETPPSDEDGSVNPPPMPPSPPGFPAFPAPGRRVHSQP